MIFLYILQAFLFLSIVLCIEVILRASSFMYNRARKHTTQLREAIQKTKMMMKRIRGGQFPDDSYCAEVGAGEGETKQFERTNQSEGNENNQNKRGDCEEFSGTKRVERTLRFSSRHDEVKGSSKTSRRQIAEMKEEDLQMEWERHEAEVHKYLEEREKINDQTSVLVSADANSSRMSFEQFWRESCKFWADIAILFFYAGTANLLLAIMIYMWAEFFITYESPVGAVIAVVFIGVSLVLGILLAIYLRQNDTYGKGPTARKRPQRQREGGRERERDSEEDHHEEDSRENRRGGRENPSGSSHMEEKDESYQQFPPGAPGSPPRRDGYRPNEGSDSRGPGYENDLRDYSFWNTTTITRHDSDSEGRDGTGGREGGDRDHPLASANMVSRSTHIRNAQTVPETPPLTPLNPIDKKSIRSRDLRPSHLTYTNS